MKVLIATVLAVLPTCALLFGLKCSEYKRTHGPWTGKPSPPVITSEIVIKDNVFQGAPKPISIKE